MGAPLKLLVADVKVNRIVKGIFLSSLPEHVAEARADSASKSWHPSSALGSCPQQAVQTFAHHPHGLQGKILASIA